MNTLGVILIILVILLLGVLCAGLFYVITRQIQLEQKLVRTQDFSKSSLQTMMQMNHKVDQVMMDASAGLKGTDELRDQVSSITRVMTNAKRRGSWGEYQLESLVRTYLGDSPYIYSTQYPLENGKISDGAFHLPGTEQVLCIDSKFPMENYLKMAAEPESAAFFEKELRRNIRKHILDVSEKYITPQTLDTAILFIPNEGLFEYLCSDGADLMSFALEHHVMLVSPTTLAGVVFTLLASTKSFYRAQNLQEIESRMEDLSRKAQTLALQSDKGRKACATLDKTLDDLSRQAWNLVRSMEEISTPDPGQYPGQSEGKTRGSGL